MSFGINLADYASGSLNNPSFGVANTSLSEIEKALSAGHITGRETEGLTNAGMAPLKVESLDKTLKLQTFKESDLVSWKRFPKKPAYNTTEEYNQLLSYGADRGGFYAEGETPSVEDSVYRRQSEHIKFLGITKSVTHPAQLVSNSVGNLVQKEVQNATLWILRKVDRALPFADADLVSEEFNGLFKQHRKSFASLDSYDNSDVVIDLRGAMLQESHIEDAAQMLIDNHADPDLLMAPPGVLNDFVKGFYGNKFIPVNGDGVTAGVMGQRVKKFASQFGDIDLAFDKFMRNQNPRLLGDDATHPEKAPLKPVADGAAPAAAVADVSGRFRSDYAGDYYYAVAALNRFGESSLTLLTANLLTVAAGQSADLKFTSGGGVNAANSFVIYRSVKNPAGNINSVKFYPIFTVNKQALIDGYDGGAAGLVRDRNRVISNTQMCYIGQDDSEVYEFAQLAPLMKMDLAVTGPFYSFMTLLYGAPLLYSPKKIIVLKNVGQIKP